MKKQKYKRIAGPQESLSKAGFNRKVRKVLTQNSQREAIQLFTFAFFAITLRPLRLKN